MNQSPLHQPDIEAADRWWIENVYRGDRMRQISVRSIVSGMLIGGVMSVSNLYVGLKTGWGLGVTITSCIIAYAVFKSLEALIPAYRRDPFTILENCTMTSAASGAAYIYDHCKNASFQSESSRRTGGRPTLKSAISCWQCCRGWSGRC